MIIEVLQWAEQLNEKRQLVELSVSNIVIALYVISYILNKKGCLIVAFLSCELWGYGVFSDWASNEMFYGGYALIYCLLYFYIKINVTQSVTKLSGIILMILLSIGMFLDALVYPNDKTSFWSNYEVNVLLLHIYIVITFIDWKLLRIYMGQSVNAFCRIMGISDAFRFCWYNIKNQVKQ